MNAFFCSIIFSISQHIYQTVTYSYVPTDTRTTPARLPFYRQTTISREVFFLFLNFCERKLRRRPLCCRNRVEKLVGGISKRPSYKSPFSTSHSNNARYFPVSNMTIFYRSKWFTCTSTRVSSTMITRNRHVSFRKLFLSLYMPQPIRRDRSFHERYVRIVILNEITGSGHPVRKIGEFITRLS